MGAVWPFAAGDQQLGGLSVFLGERVPLHQDRPRLGYHGKHRTGRCFQESFRGEGNVDVVAAPRALHEVGFDGFILDDHVPHLIEDTE
jgi:hypothetical protein